MLAAATTRTQEQDSNQFGVAMSANEGTTFVDVNYYSHHYQDYIFLALENGEMVGHFISTDDAQTVYEIRIIPNYCDGQAQVNLGGNIAYMSMMQNETSDHGGGTAKLSAVCDTQSFQPAHFEGSLGLVGTNITIEMHWVGDPAWLLINATIGGGGGGVDSNDWDYWFDNEIGKFHNIHDGLVSYFGDGETEGQVATDMATIVDKLDIIAYALSSPVPIVNTEFVMPEINEEELDFEIDTKIDEVKDLFAEIEINETESVDDEVEIVLPLESWLSYFDSGIQDITLSVETGPFQSVKAPLAIIIYALLSLWAILFIFNEFRRTG